MLADIDRSHEGRTDDASFLKIESETAQTPRRPAEFNTMDVSRGINYQKVTYRVWV
jgi:hypothetical protein